MISKSEYKRLAVVAPHLAIKKLIADYFIVEEFMVENDTNFVDDLGADSLDMVELHHELEDALCREIPAEALQECKTVADIIGVLK